MNYSNRNHCHQNQTHNNSMNAIFRGKKKGVLLDVYNLHVASICTEDHIPNGFV